MKKGDKSKVNSMIEAFGERYLVLNHDGGYLLYDKERKSPRTNALFMGKFYISTNGDSYVYNEDRFSSVSDLVKRMEAHNSSLPFSSDIYDPSYRKHIKIELALHDYLVSLGFIHKRGVTAYSAYILQDGYGQTLMEIDYSVTRDTTSGCVERPINQNRWVESPFCDLESAIGAVNGIIASYYSLFNAKVVSVFSKLTEARATQMLDKSFSSKEFTIYVSDAKKEAIGLLERELSNLKG